MTNAAGLPASPFITDIVAAERSDEGAVETSGSAAVKKRSQRSPPDLTHPPLVPTDIGMLPGSAKRLDIFLLMGQSNMKKGAASCLRNPYAMIGLS